MMVLLWPWHWHGGGCVVHRGSREKPVAILGVVARPAMTWGFSFAETEISNQLNGFVTSAPPQLQNNRNRHMS